MFTRAISSRPVWGADISARIAASLVVGMMAVGLALFTVAPAGASEATWNGASVVSYMRVAPLNGLRRDVMFLAEVLDTESLPADFEAILNELALGVDGARPMGVVVPEGDAPIPIVFLPVKDEGQLFATLRLRLGLEFYRGDDGYYRGGNISRGGTIGAAARVVGQWLYLTSGEHRQLLARVPDDPSELFSGLDPAMAAQVVVLVDRMPLAWRELVAEKVRQVGAAPDSADTLSAASAEMAGRAARQLLADSQRWEFDLQCFRPLEQFHVSARVAPKQHSRLAQWLAAMANRPVQFEHLADGDVVAGLVSSMAFDPEAVAPLVSYWIGQAAQYRASAPSPQAADAGMRRLGQLTEQSLTAVTTTLRQGEFDGGLVLQRRGTGPFVLLAGGTLSGARAINDTAVEVGQFLQQSDEFRAWKWAVDEQGDATVQRLQFPLADPSMQRAFGSMLFTAFGFGPERMYVALGDEQAAGSLTTALERSRGVRPAHGETLRATLHMAGLTEFFEAISDEGDDAQQNFAQMAERIAPYRRNDTLELAIQARPEVLEGRLRIDRGVVRMFAPETPPPVAPPTTEPPPQRPADGLVELALRLPRGEQFQRAFLSESKVTTMIDGLKHVDQGRHWLLFDFAVCDVAADGTMQIETRLNRVTIHKSTPGGESDYDSANPPPMDQMDAEMLLHGLLVNRRLTLTVRPDGTIMRVDGLDEAIADVVDNELQPPPEERQQAWAFVAQFFNESGLRDTLTRGFEFYPSAAVAVGGRWTRTSENFSGVNFLLDSRYVLQSLTDRAAEISVKSQVREKEVVEVQPIAWDVVGSQTGSLSVEPRSGLVQFATYALNLSGEATLHRDDMKVVRPVDLEIKISVGDPARVPAR